MNNPATRIDYRIRASEILNCLESELKYFAWTETFKATSSSVGGYVNPVIAGRLIEAWSDSCDAAVFCEGEFIQKVKNFDFNTNVSL